MTNYGSSILGGRAGFIQKRKVFFSFHYDDIMRVNNVRNVWKINHPDSAQMRSFYDSSLWESKKLESDESVKILIREGVSYTSVVCVLIGTETWSRRWVKYEIARSVIDGKGLVGIHLNGINHHQRMKPDNRGYNPIAMMGISAKNDGQYYLCEHVHNGQSYEWKWYADYTLSVNLPKYCNPVQVGSVVKLSDRTREYDFAAQNGATNLGGWIDLAAVEAGR